MHHAAKIVVPALVALLLTACSSNGVSAPPVPQAPTATQQQVTAQSVQSQSQSLSTFDIFITGARGESERAHIFKPRGTPFAGAGGNLTWHGGPIQHVPKIFVVYWQFAKYGDPTGEASYLSAFLGGVGGSSWLNSVTQYYGPVGTFGTNPSGQLGGTWNDSTNSIPKRMSSSAIAGEAVRAAAHFGYSADASYVIATPHGHSTSGFGSQFCAWHSSTSSASGPVAFTNLPYITDAGASCGQNFVNGGSAGTNDGVSIVGGHELAETQTDPQPSSGWVDASGAENGDKCAWISSGQGASADITLGGKSYAVQSLWSNAFSGGTGGCVISYP